MSADLAVEDQEDPELDTDYCGDVAMKKTSGALL
jgi:hypothetical protein